LASCLTLIGENIWLADGGIVDFYGFPYPTRSVVVRLSDGALWVWSPINLTKTLQDELDALGRVTHLVSPNKIHHLFLSDWKAVYPGARIWGPPSTVAKRTDLAFEPPLGDISPPDWGNEIDQVWFRGSFLFDEIVFFHSPSKTAIIADLSENFSDHFLMQHWKGWQRWIARIWKITVGYGFAPLELRLSWLDRKQGRKALDKLLSWQAERVVMAHGEWQRKDGQAFLNRAFAWLAK